MTVLSASLTASSSRPLPARPRPVARRAAAAAPARLTRRGRLMVLVVLAALLFTAFSLGRAASQAASEPVATAQLEQTTVMPGDTLWAVARRIAPANDPREVVAQIRQLNDLSTSTLYAGQQLLLPVAA